LTPPVRRPWARARVRRPPYFAADFPALKDGLCGYPVGGFGGLRRHGALHHTPVVFVHGNQVDAQNWLDVMLQFQNDAGYSMQEMYALSYNGLENYYAGAPVTVAPTAADQAYLAHNPNVLANGGHGSSDDDEVLDLCRFIEAVQAYTGSPPDRHRRPFPRRHARPAHDAALSHPRAGRGRLRRHRGGQPRHDRLPRARSDLLRLQRDRPWHSLARAAERARREQ
jgi:hypothetical protein